MKKDVLRPSNAEARYYLSMGLFLGLFLALCLFSGPIHADSDKVIIKSVVADLSNHSMTIRGSGFDRINDTTVTLGEYGVLQIQSETSSQIVTDLPNDIVPGNYRLTVTVTKGSSQTDEFSVAIIESPPTYEVGDVGPAGGTVFYVTDGGLHGLEAAPEDQDGGKGAEWGCYGTMLHAAYGYEMGEGDRNTYVIVRTCPVAGIAAIIADEYSHNGFNDWFLPSYKELYELYRNRNVVGGFDSIGLYWSSTTADGEYKSWFMYFNDGTHHEGWRDNSYHVRAIRKF